MQLAVRAGSLGDGRPAQHPAALREQETDRGGVRGRRGRVGDPAEHGLQVGRGLADARSGLDDLAQVVPGQPGPGLDHVRRPRPRGDLQLRVRDAVADTDGERRTRRRVLHDPGQLPVQAGRTGVPGLDAVAAFGGVLAHDRQRMGHPARDHRVAGVLRPWYVLLQQGRGVQLQAVRPGVREPPGRGDGAGECVTAGAVHHGHAPRAALLRGFDHQRPPQPARPRDPVRLGRVTRHRPAGCGDPGRCERLTHQDLVPGRPGEQRVVAGQSDPLGQQRGERGEELEAGRDTRHFVPPAERLHVRQRPRRVREVRRAHPRERGAQPDRIGVVDLLVGRGVQTQSQPVGGLHQETPRVPHWLDHQHSRAARARPDSHSTSKAAGGKRRLSA